MAFGNYFRGRRVLVTGHTGFKGAWLSLWLSHLGAEVHGLALPREVGLYAFIRNGTFAREWIEENKQGGRNFALLRKMEEKHQIEEVGANLRGMMSWLQKDNKKASEAAEKPVAQAVNA